MHIYVPFITLVSTNQFHLQDVVLAESQACCQWATSSEPQRLLLAFAAAEAALKVDQERNATF